MKKLVCGCFGKIYYAEILKNGLMSDRNRVDVTDDAITAVMDHIMSMEEYKERDGFSGYEYGKKTGDGSIIIAVYDNTKYKLVRRQDEEKNDSKESN